MKAFDFSGKFAIVTGGSRGIGKAIAEALLRMDCRVLITSTGAKPSWCSRYKDRCEHRAVNFLNELNLKKFLEEIKKMKRIDILVNCAGIHIPEAIYDVKDKDWDAIMQINLNTPMKIMREVACKMKAAKNGKILNISSIAGVISRPRQTAYSATKAGLIGLTRSSALDLAPYNILVNALCPGHTKTNMMERLLTVSERKRLAESIPLKRFADPKEIANFVLFLCSGLNTYITGQAIVVDGGMTIK